MMTTRNAGDLFAETDLPEVDRDAFIAFVENGNVTNEMTADEAFVAFCNSYLGLSVCVREHGRDLPTGYAAELVENGVFGNIPEGLRRHMDYASIAADLVLNGDVWVSTRGLPRNECHVFRNL